VAKTFGAPNQTLPTPSTNTSQAVDTSGGAAPVTWTFTVLNTGTNATTGTVDLTDVMDPGFTFTGFTGAGWACTPDVTLTVVTCTYNLPLGPNATANTLTITSNVAPTVTYGDHPDTATVSLCAAPAPRPCAAINTLPQQNAGGHSASAITTVYPFDVFVVSLTDTPDPVSAAAADPSLAYTITVQNNSAGGQAAPFGWFVDGDLALRNTPLNGSATGNVTTVANIFSVTSPQGTCTNPPAPAGAYPVQPTATSQHYSCQMQALPAGQQAVITVLVNVVADQIEPPFLSLDANLTNVSTISTALVQATTAAEFNVGDLVGAPPTTARPPAALVTNDNRPGNTAELTTVNP